MVVKGHMELKREEGEEEKEPSPSLAETFHRLSRLEQKILTLPSLAVKGRQRRWKEPMFFFSSQGGRRLNPLEGNPGP